MAIDWNYFTLLLNKGKTKKEDVFFFHTHKKSKKDENLDFFFTDRYAFRIQAQVEAPSMLSFLEDLKRIDDESQ